MEGSASAYGDRSAAAPARMTTVSRHYFGASASDHDHDLRVDIIELGAGTSLPGLVAAKVGANVTLTDIARNTEVLDNIRRICSLNSTNCNVLELTWGSWDEPIFDLHPDIILGADVLYDSASEIGILINLAAASIWQDFDDLFATVTFLLENSPGAVFITTYHNRSGHHLIDFLMVKWGLKCLKLLDGFSFLPSCKATSLQGDIQLVEITLNPDKTKRPPGVD